MSVDDLRYAMESEISRCEREWSQQLMFAERFFGQESRSIQEKGPHPAVPIEGHWDAVTGLLQVLERKGIILREVVSMVRNLLTGQFLHLPEDCRRSFLEELKSGYEDSLRESIADSAPCVARAKVALRQGRLDCVRFIEYLTTLC